MEMIKRMIGNTKTRKAIIATIMAILSASGAYVALAAVNYYYTLQKGTQHVDYAYSALVKNFTLPAGYVNVSQFAIAQPSPVINITTYVTGLNLTLHTKNYAALQTRYCVLELQVRNYTDDTLLGTLNLRSNTTLIIPLQSIRTYTFNYRILYTPAIKADNEILLDATIKGTV